MVPTFTPPTDFYDQPFHWIYDASGLTDGANAQNLSQYIQAGFGDFWLRRIVGLASVVNPVGGKYQIKDKNLNYIQSDPAYVSPASDDIAVIPEIEYQERGAIRFDLYNVLRVDPPLFRPVTELQVAGGNSNQAWSVAMSGNYLIVGAPTGPQGIVYVYVVSATGATLVQTIVSPSTYSPGLVSFGQSVSFDSTTGILVIGDNASTQGGDAAAGAFFIYTLTAGQFVLTQTVPNPVPAVDDFFGANVAVSGTTIMAFAGFTTGGVGVYTISGGVWSLTQNLLTGTTAGFGSTLGSNSAATQIELQGLTAVIGNANLTSSTGNATVFTFSGGAWNSVQTLAPAGIIANDHFGWSVSLQGTTLAISAPRHGVNGAVYIYTLVAGTWTLFQTLLSPNPLTAAALNFGYAVALDASGTNLLAGSPADNAGAGNTYYYNLSAGTWSLAQTIYVTGALRFGGSLTVQTVAGQLNAAFGAPGTGVGAAYIQTTDPIYKSQIAFMGVARKSGKQPQLAPPYKFKPKSFTYIQQVLINLPGLDSNGNPAPAVSAYQLITDYDFDLFDIRIVYSGPNVIPPVVATIMLWNSVKEMCSNIPMLDKFWNGAPGSQYENGSIVPALLYPKQSQIRLDFYSKVPSAYLPIVATVHFVGQNRFPCQ